MPLSWRSPANGNTAAAQAAERIARILVDKTGFADRIKQTLENRNSRIHLQQTMSREVREIDFSLVDQLPDMNETATDSSPPILDVVKTHLRSGYSLYNDLLKLNDNKELEFIFETLRNRHEDFVRMR